jgi:hypothetical protein
MLDGKATALTRPIADLYCNEATPMDPVTTEHVLVPFAEMMAA